MAGMRHSITHKRKWLRLKATLMSWLMFWLMVTVAFLADLVPKVCSDRMGKDGWLAFDQALDRRASSEPSLELGDVFNVIWLRHGWFDTVGGEPVFARTLQQPVSAGPRLHLI